MTKINVILAYTIFNMSMLKRNRMYNKTAEHENKCTLVYKELMNDGIYAEHYSWHIPNNFHSDSFEKFSLT